MDLLGFRRRADAGRIDRSIESNFIDVRACARVRVHACVREKTKRGIISIMGDYKKEHPCTPNVGNRDFETFHFPLWSTLLTMM
jgi:hypothetical protein